MCGASDPWITYPEVNCLPQNFSVTLGIKNRQDHFGAPALLLAQLNVGERLAHTQPKLAALSSQHPLSCQEPSVSYAPCSFRYWRPPRLLIHFPGQPPPSSGSAATHLPSMIIYATMWSVTMILFGKENLNWFQGIHQDDTSSWNFKSTQPVTEGSNKSDTLIIINQSYD